MRRAAALMALTAGCSFITLHGDRARRPCQTSSLAPIGDIVVAAFGVVVASPGVIYLVTKHGEFSGLAIILSVVPGSAVALPWGLSAGYGFVTTAECRSRYARDGLVQIKAHVIAVRLRDGKRMAVLDHGSPAVSPCRLEAVDGKVPLSETLVAEIDANRSEVDIVVPETCGRGGSCPDVVLACPTR